MKKRRRNTQRKLLLITILCLLLVSASILAVSIYRKINNEDVIMHHVVEEKKNQNEKKDGIITNNIIVKVDVSLNKKEKINIPTGSKFVALTFDDGPGYDSTKRILDVLAKYNAKGTWFVLGSKVDSNPTMLKQISDSGHEVANHSYSHPNLVNLDLHSALENINAASNSIYNVIGKYPNYLRPPYGSYNATISSNTNLGIALWSVDSLDWKYRNGQAAYEHVMSTLTPNPVILFHDIYDTSADAIELLVPRLAKEGYTFVTYSEMMAIKGG